MRYAPMTSLPALRLLAAPALALGLMVGCQTKPPATKAGEPTWSHRDATARLSSNDVIWEQMIPATAQALTPTDTVLAGVEESNR